MACQAPLSMGFSRQEYWTVLPFPSPGDLSNPGIKPGSPELKADSLLSELQGKSSSFQLSSVAQSCPTLCDPMNHSMPGLPPSHPSLLPSLHHQLPEFTQTHVHQVSDAIKPLYPLSHPFPSCPQSLPASESFPMSQLFS